MFSIDLGGYDPRASTELQDSLSRMMKIMGKPNLANYFPSLEFLDIQGIRKEMKVCSERLFQIFQGLVDARIAERSSQTGPRDALRGDLLDSLIDLIQEEGSEVDMNDINHFLCVSDLSLKISMEKENRLALQIFSDLNLDIKK